MKFNVPRITRPLSLADYAPEYVDDSGQPITIWVWVNPPRKLVAEFYAIRRGFVEAVGQAQQAPTDDQAVLGERGSALVKLNERLCDWFAEIWSQHDGAEPWTRDEVNKLIAELGDTDPEAWAWLLNQTLGAIEQHREGAKKN